MQSRDHDSVRPSDFRGEDRFRRFLHARRWSSGIAPLGLCAGRGKGLALPQAQAATSRALSAGAKGDRKVSEATKTRCPIRYLGASVPQARGTRCEKDAEHDGERHFAHFAGSPLAWWTPEEKEAIRARRRASRSGKTEGAK